jgi:hypothetical protein
MSKTQDYSKPSVTKEATMAGTTAARTRQNPLLKYLEGDDVLTSSELIARLTKDGRSEAAARQVIRRTAGKGIWRSEKLRLPKDERLFADARFAQTPAFFRAVGRKLALTSRGGLARCLETLGAREALHKIDVMRLLAVAPANGKALPKRTYEHELGGLAEIGVQVVHHGTALESIVVPGKGASADAQELASRAASAVRREGLLARVLAERFRRQNMFAWNRVEFPDSEMPFTTFNNQVFSAFGFSYLSPLVRWKADKGKPSLCPVLIDVYHGLCLPSQVESFLRRIERATVRGKSRMPCLGIIAAKDFDREAWSAARSKGLMTVSFRQLFGEEALEAMAAVEELLHGLTREARAAGGEGQFLRFADLLKELKTNPVVTTLRSIGFEALSGLALGSLGYQSIEMGRIVPWQETTRDVDTFGFRGDELRVVECKAYHRKKSLLPEDVTKFFTETVPALKKWLRDNNRTFNTCKAEVWTTGPLGREAREALHKLARPKADQWELVHGGVVEDLLPHAVKARGVQLLHAIALEEHQSGEE